MYLSVLDIFKIGIGPSSSHTVGPMRAADMFVSRLDAEALLQRTARIRCELYGSLGSTGKGHGTDTAIVLGLCGHAPESVDVDAIAGLLAEIRRAGSLALRGEHRIAFQEVRDLQFLQGRTLPLHANGMRFTALDASGQALAVQMMDKNSDKVAQLVLDWLASVGLTK